MLKSMQERLVLKNKLQDQTNEMMLANVLEKVNNYVTYFQQDTCTYQIPTFLPGYPLINVPIVMNFLLNKLFTFGLVVYQINPNTILITIPKENNEIIIPSYNQDVSNAYGLKKPLQQPLHQPLQKPLQQQYQQPLQQQYQQPLQQQYQQPLQQYKQPLQQPLQQYQQQYQQPLQQYQQQYQQPRMIQQSNIEQRLLTPIISKKNSNTQKKNSNEIFDENSDEISNTFPVRIGPRNSIESDKESAELEDLLISINLKNKKFIDK